MVWCLAKMRIIFGGVLCTLYGGIHFFHCILFEWCRLCYGIFEPFSLATLHSHHTMWYLNYENSYLFCVAYVFVRTFLVSSLQQLLPAYIVILVCVFRFFDASTETKPKTEIRRRRRMKRKQLILNFGMPGEKTKITGASSLQLQQIIIK